MSMLLAQHLDAVNDLKAIIAKSQKDAKAKLRIGVAGFTGWGDMAVQLAVCAELKTAIDDAHVFALLHFSGTMVESDLAECSKVAGLVDDYAIVHSLVEQWRRPLVNELAPCFDILYDAAGPAIRTIVNPKFKGYAKAQAEANSRLSCYADLHSGWPLTGCRVKSMHESRWDIMSHTLGLDVTPDDLIAPLECAPFPTHIVNGGPAEIERMHKRAMSDKWSSAKLPDDVKNYVVVNNCCGRGGGTKQAPADVMDAIVSKLDKMGVRVVQIGRDDEPQIRFTIDRRGYRMPIGVRLLQGAITGVFIEGFWAYMAHVIKPSCILFGPTPVNHYALPGNVNMLNAKQNERGEIQTACPEGSCFQSRGERWGDYCPLMGIKFPDGKAVNPRAPYCGNFDAPDVAAAKVARVVDKLMESKPR